MKRILIYLMVFMLTVITLSACTNSQSVSLPFNKSSRDSKVNMDIKTTFIPPDKYILDFKIPNVIPSSKGTIYYGNKQINFIPSGKSNVIDIDHEEENLQFTIYYMSVYDYIKYKK